MKLKPLVAITALSAVLPVSMAFAAAPPPTAIASIDWSSFAVQIVDTNYNDNIDAAITWTSKSSYVNVNSASNSVADWTSGISSSDGVASAVAQAATLTAQFSSDPASVNSSAWLWRNGDFTLTANTLAIFTVKANTYIDMAIPPNGAGYAWAYLNVDGPGSDGVDVQHGGTDSISWAAGLGTPVTNARRLQAIFFNGTDSDIKGTLSAFATANKYGSIPTIPEPGTYAMLLAGLGLLGFVAWRRQKEDTAA